MEGPPSQILKPPSVSRGTRLGRPAQKVCLIDISLVFNGMFFGPMKETGEMIEVKETIPGAFCDMIIDDQPPLQDSWRPSVTSADLRTKIRF